MEVIYHPLARRDVLDILRYYHGISPRLADSFRDELQSTISQAARNPNRFSLVERGFHRANLKRFPYHLLYETEQGILRLMVVRHNRRHPDLGLERH